MKIMQRFCIVPHITCLAFLILTACAGFSTASKTLPTDLPPHYAPSAPNATQMLLVVDDSFLFIPSTKVYALVKDGTDWRRAFDPISAVIGRNGFAPPGEKREGDGRTPSGLYRLGTAFGYEEKIETKMPYRQALTDDVWVDDPESPDYNRLVKQDQTAAVSYEKMKREDDLYQYGLVIEYNTAPVIKNYGSAIFMHVWDGSWTNTAGCVAVSKDNMIKILAWLDPAAHPVIVLNPQPLQKEDP